MLDDVGPSGSLLGKHKKQKFQCTKTGVDFNTKKCLILQGSMPNPDPGLFFGVALKFTSSFQVGMKTTFRQEFLSHLTDTCCQIIPFI